MARNGWGIVTLGVFPSVGRTCAGEGSGQFESWETSIGNSIALTVQGTDVIIH